MHLQQGYKHEIFHDDVIKWKHFPRYWPFVRGIHRSPVNSPHKGQWRGALMFTLICARINGWVNNREAGDLRRYPAHCDVIVMCWKVQFTTHCRINETQPSQCNHHTMDLLWEKFQWILTLYINPISFQSKASVVCSVTAAIFINFLPEETKCVFPTYW